MSGDLKLFDLRDSLNQFKCVSSVQIACKSFISFIHFSHILNFSQSKEENHCSTKTEVVVSSRRQVLCLWLFGK